MIIIQEIKEIIYNFIQKEYEKYLNEKNILLINSEDLYDIIKNVYDNNIKNIKQTIRYTLKQKYKDEYPSLSVENILLDLFQDEDLNINKICNELLLVQKKNYLMQNIPIINNSLNLNISIIDNYIVINSTNKHNIEKYEEIYNILDKYKFIYSINNKILTDYSNSEKINIIKNEILNKENIDIGLYYLKNKTN